jgi:hypothetical protein
VKNPGSLEEVLVGQESARRKVSPKDVEALGAQRQRLRRGVERLIDSLAEGVINKDQFTVRMNRAKARLADLDAKIASEATVFGSATADYSSTDHVYITPLTPGLQIISASGHDYSVPQSAPEPASLSLVAASLAGWWLRGRRAKGAE